MVIHVFYLKVDVVLVSYFLLSFFFEKDINPECSTDPESSVNVYLFGIGIPFMVLRLLFYFGIKRSVSSIVHMLLCYVLMVLMYPIWAVYDLVILCQVNKWCFKPFTISMFNFLLVNFAQLATITLFIIIPVFVYKVIQNLEVQVVE